jgi:hypothetical protein
VLLADEDTVASFLSQAPRAWEEAISYQDRLEGRYTKTMIISPSKRMLYSVEGEYKCIKGHRYLQYHLTNYSGHSYKTPFGLHPRYGFVLDRAAADPDWKISVLEKEAKVFVLDRLARQEAVLHPGFTVDWQSLLWTVRQPGFTLKGATTFTEEGVDLVEITFQTDDFLHEDRKLLGGAVTLMPERNWAIREYEVTILAGDGESKVKGRVEYEGQPVAVPIATESETWIGGMDGVYTHNEIIEFSGICTCWAPASDFKLPKFGLPDIGT